MAAPMSPLIFSFPVMYALVGFTSPATIFSNVSWEVEITTSASPPPSVTVTLPSSTSTFHWPTPSMSKTYELFMPAVFSASVFASRVAKNSWTASAISHSLDSRLTRDSTAILRCGAPAWDSIAAAMGVTIEIGLPGQATADALAVPVGRPPHGLGGEGGRIVDEKLDGGLTRLLASGELRGDTGEALVLHVEGALETPRVVAVGI